MARCAELWRPRLTSCTTTLRAESCFLSLRVFATEMEIMDSLATASMVTEGKKHTSNSCGM